MIGISKTEIDKLASEWTEALYELVADFPTQVDIIITVQRKPRNELGGEVVKKMESRPSFQPSLKRGTSNDTTDDVTIYENGSLS
ncbi:unnamed protein product, partial [Mesorhabditis belari]|uniref:Uncharacterized protein n=1 Tax=Mesorhabditis belari TaxID=2138241 RepID=A0AAF3J4F7_9BILA